MNSNNELSYTLNKILEQSRVKLKKQVKKQRTIIIWMLIDKIHLGYRTCVQLGNSLMWIWKA